MAIQQTLTIETRLMAFDTIYFFAGGQQHVTRQAIKPGGVDTVIFLTRGQLPPGIEPGILYTDSLVSQYQLTPIVDITEEENDTAGLPFIFAFIAVLAIIFFKAWQYQQRSSTYSRQVYGNGAKPVASPSLKYYGDELNFSDEQLVAILNKRFPYYTALDVASQLVFIKRLQKFMADKIFKIHDEKGYREMPVLISAAAIQLTFGLKKYLLPHFKFIHIHPQEFLRVKPILCFLEGNVSGHSINLSWKHFLAGYDDPCDGQNVGLHELAHALYYQTFEVEQHADRNFRNYYNDFNVDGNKAYHVEKTIAGGLYSEYAEKNFQEFWAESVEIFFEKPVAMQSHYPQLYQTMKTLLNQDPVTKIPLPGS